MLGYCWIAAQNYCVSHVEYSLLGMYHVQQLQKQPAMMAILHQCTYEFSSTSVQTCNENFMQT